MAKVVAKRKNSVQKPKRSAKIKKAAQKTPAGDITLAPDEFAAICSDALGGRGWQRSFIHGTGLAQSTISRYLKGAFPIPQYIALICQMLQMLRANGLPVPEAFTVRTDD